jgi:hypothetical protein
MHAPRARQIQSMRAAAPFAMQGPITRTLESAVASPSMQRGFPPQAVSESRGSTTYAEAAAAHAAFFTASLKPRPRNKEPRLGRLGFPHLDSILEGLFRLSLLFAATLLIPRALAHRGARQETCNAGIGPFSAKQLCHV